jgi:hypothetical protein
MLIAHGRNPVAFPAAPRLTAHFASANRFQLSGFDALQDGVRIVVDVEPQAAEFLFDLQDFERASGCFLGFRNERLQVFAKPPRDVEPAVAMGKSICHSGLALIACDVEPTTANARPAFVQVHCAWRSGSLRELNLMFVVLPQTQDEPAF